eukprot:3749704-Pyramimonas_sp.AAC.1
MHPARPACLAGRAGSIARRVHSTQCAHFSPSTHLLFYSSTHPCPVPISLYFSNCRSRTLVAAVIALAP